MTCAGGSYRTDVERAGNKAINMTNAPYIKSTTSTVWDDIGGWFVSESI